MDTQQNFAYAGAVTRVNSVMKRVYLLMTLGLAVTAVMAWTCGTSEAYWNFMINHTWMRWVLILGEFGILFGISAGLNRLGGLAASGLFLVFSVLNGMIFASIVVGYPLAAIAKAFVITAATFTAMSVYGFFTNRDLSRWGAMLTMALIGLLIAILVNIFLHSQALDFIVSIFGVLIFTGLTAWDTQQIRRMADEMPEAGVSRLAVIGALNLYLDFLNLFLFILRIFGGNRD